MSASGGRVAGLLGLALAACTLAGCNDKLALPGGAPADPVASKVQAITASDHLDSLKYPNYASHQAQVKAFYDARSDAPAWVKDGRPTAAASAFIQQFAAADTKGLNPEDYDAAEWPARVSALRHKDDDATASFDAALTIDAMRYLSHVHQGRVDPTHFNFEIGTASKKLDLAKLLADRALESNDVSGLVSSLEPDNDQYRRTEQALGTYLRLAKEQGASPALSTPLPTVAAPVAPNGRYPAVPQLAARLQLESSGQPDATSSQGGTAYTGALIAEVKAYQAAHGLPADGKLTAATISSLNVPMTERVAQLDDSLERWRWLPEEYLHPALMVNLPEFLLRGYTGEGAAQQEDFTMKVVVGKAEGGHDTPVFTHKMQYLIFRPYWTLPMSIIKKELGPHMDAHGVGYLAGRGFEVVNGKGEKIEATTAEVERGGALVRQPPGPRNALGLVKFMFPNQYDIYMHSTPEVSLFNRNRRDFSHGCVRVQKPDELAVWVLRNQTGDWDLSKVDEAMNSGQNNRTVSLKQPLGVVMFYLTANVGEDGQVHFFDDIYGYDKQMNDVLSKGIPYPDDAVKVNPHTTPGDTT